MHEIYWWDKQNAGWRSIDELQNPVDEDIVFQAVKQQGLQGPALAFEQLLLQAGIEPRSVVLQKIAYRFASQKLAVTTPDQAKYLYETAESLPGTATAGDILNETHLSVNGPLSEETPPYLLSAVNEDGQHVVVKMLLDSQRQMPELFIVADIFSGVRDRGVRGLVVPRASSIRQHIGQSNVSVLIMPRMLMSMDRCPMYPASALKNAIENVRAGISFLHTKDWVHMDIKLDNIVVDSTQALLTDYGAAVRRGDLVQQATLQWFPAGWGIIGEPAFFCYDMHLLLVALLVHCHKCNGRWQDKLMEHKHISLQKIKVAVSELGDRDLKSVAEDLMVASIVPDADISFACEKVKELVESAKASDGKYLIGYLKFLSRHLGAERFNPLLQQVRPHPSWQAVEFAGISIKDAGLRSACSHRTTTCKLSSDFIWELSLGFRKDTRRSILQL